MTNCSDLSNSAAAVLLAVCNYVYRYTVISYTVSLHFLKIFSMLISVVAYTGFGDIWQT